MNPRPALPNAPMFGNTSDLCWEEDSAPFRKVPALVQDQSVRAFGLLEAAGAFAIFMASCFAKKIFDELYERLLKRPLTPFLDRLFSPDSPAHGRSVALRDVIYLRDIDTTIVIRAIVVAQNADEANALLLKGHRVAHAYISANGRKAPVHCHTIQLGQINLEPELFLSLNDEHRHSFSTSPIQPRA